MPLTGLSLNPMFAAAAMSLSSFCVVTNALRLNFFRAESADRDKKGKEVPMPVWTSGFTGIKEKENKKKAEERKEKGNMVKVLDVEGMMCAKCQAHVQKALEGVEGVTAVDVSLEDKQASVTMENDVPDETLCSAVTEAGYEVKGCNIKTA